MTQAERYLQQLERAGRAIVVNGKGHGLHAVVVYGSLARGHLGIDSDIDILVVLDATTAETFQIAKSRIVTRMPDEVELVFPEVHMKFCSVKAYNVDADDATPWGVFMRNVREEGHVLWPQ